MKYAGPKELSAHKGFTLVEIMVALAITAMFLMLGVPSFAQWIQNTRLRNAADGIQTGIQLARSESIRRNTRVQLDFISLEAGGTSSDWRVGCVTTSAGCPAEIQSMAAKEGASSAVVTSSVSAISYNAIGRLSPAPANDLVIDVTNPDAGNCAPAGEVRCQRLIVSITGQVRRCDPALATTLPGSC